MYLDNLIMKLSEVLKSQLESMKESLDRMDEILERSSADLKSDIKKAEELDQWLDDWSRIVD